jgi:AcrR family transcriptional regulator
MQAKSNGVELTVTEQARRAQIVAAAIDTIAELGYSGASFSRIAQRAGLSSTGLISYHFRGKQDLMAEVMRTIMAEFTRYVMQRYDDGTAAGALRVFIEANMDFMREHRNHLLTMLRIHGNQATQDVAAGTEQADADRGKVAALLRGGQDSGEFRDFDADVMAGFILSLRNGVIARLAVEPAFDVTQCAAELITVIELATRKRDQ